MAGPQQPQPSVATCPRCGTAVWSTALACHVCGYPGPRASWIPTGPAPQPFVAPAWSAAPVRRSWAPFVIVGVLLVLVALVAAGLAVNTNGSASGAAQNHPPASQPEQADQNLPPAGAIWFGTSFDTTTLAISGQASVFHQGDPMVLVAHLSRAVPSGQPMHVLMDGVPLESEVTASAAYLDRVGLVLYSSRFPVGVHTFVIEDAGGNALAQGKATIDP